ncbi:MAG: TRAP transporter small permease [Litoreibacter sp.]|uniref:TRAP transporter small permease subunit n=1 Tax=Litoreibacter sp. TaxID=1969459 RepID=UPI0032988EDE
MTLPDAQAPQPLLRRAVQKLSWCLGMAVTSMNALGTMIIIVMMVLICADVVGRNLFATSLPGVIELAELGIVSLVFLQIADTLRSGKLMRSDVLINTIVAKYPRVGAFMNLCFDTTGALLFYFIANGAFERFWDAWRGGFYLGNQGSFTAPTWPMELCVAMGSALMCVLFITHALVHLARLFGVPMVTAQPAEGSQQ